MCARHLVVLDYSADGDSLVEQVPHCSTVSLSFNYTSSAVVWVYCQSVPIVYSRISHTLAALNINIWIFFSSLFNTHSLNSHKY